MGEQSYFQRKFFHNNNNNNNSNNNNNNNNSGSGGGKCKRLKKGGSSPSTSQNSVDANSGSSAECNGQPLELPRRQFPPEFSPAACEPGRDCSASAAAAADSSGQIRQQAAAAACAGARDEIEPQERAQEREQEQETAQKSNGRPCGSRGVQTRASFDGNTAAERRGAGSLAAAPNEFSCDSSREHELGRASGGSGGATAAAAAATSNELEAANKTARSANCEEEEEDHIETIAFHPEPTASAAPLQQAASGRGQPKESKLRKATRAILSLRRATSSLAGAAHHGDESSSGHRGFSYPRALVATFWRQNTADNSTCTRSARHDDSFNSYHWAAHLNGGSGGAGGPSSQPDIVGQLASRPARAADADQQSSSASSSAFRLPQFIVPKMNALKLPIVCLIKSLDGELMREIFVHRYELGQYLIDNLKVSLDMKDAKYFGLKLARSLEEQDDVRQPWLDLNESVYKQISKHCKPSSMNQLNLGGGGAVESQRAASAQNNPPSASASTTTKSVDFYLKIKFYPPNLARIQDPFLKQYLWLQLRRDLRVGKLTSSMNNLTLLMACALQYELGDFKQEHVGEQLARLNVLPNQDLIEQQALDIWRTRLAGIKRHQVQMQFLRASVILETYGFDYYSVRDHQRQRAYLLGFNYAGIKTVRNGRIAHHFRWHNLSKISYERRMIIFHIYPSENSKRKQILGFKCLSNEDCQNLYMRLQEQKYFFTVDLTYFDKSLRRPSHLAESALGEREQQQLASWAGGGASSSSPEGQPSELQFDDDLDEFGDLCETACRPQEQARARPRATQQEPQQQAQQQEIAGGRQRHERPLPDASGAPLTPAFNGCACADCKRHLQMARQHHHSNNQSLESTSSGPAASLAGAPAPGHPAGQLVKSSSFQESTPTSCSSARRPNCCETGRPGASHSANSPESSSSFANQPSCCAPPPQSSSTYPPEAARPPADGDFERAHLPHCSAPKYSPDFEMIDEAARELERQSGAFATPTRNGDNHDNDLGQRVASWAEQVLTQPARVFTCQDNWSQRPAEQQQRQQQQQLTNRNQQQFSQQPRAFDGSLFMQGLLFCLLILVMDLALRLSDSVSSALQAWLTFGHEAAGGAQQACRSPPGSPLAATGSANG